MNKFYEMYFCGSSIGKVGERVPNYLHNSKEDMYVGDLIHFKIGSDEYLRHLIKSHKKENSYGFMGFGIDNLKFENMVKVCSYEDFDKELFLKLRSNDLMSVEEFEIRNITIEEIEEILGFKINLI